MTIGLSKSDRQIGWRLRAKNGIWAERLAKNGFMVEVKAMNVPLTDKQFVNTSH
jgi:hypothetical protein